MILSFRHKGLKKFHFDDNKRLLPSEHVERIRTLLSAIDQAQSPRDLERPSFRLHSLKGDRKGAWAVTVRANWRIVFTFEGEDVVNVDLVDYH
ncbi:MAG: type II toxin-antitoxin system RelE/ParE family toxin [Bdellovibrionales bacterium]